MTVLKIFTVESFTRLSDVFFWMQGAVSRIVDINFRVGAAGLGHLLDCRNPGNIIQG